MQPEPMKLEDRVVVVDDYEGLRGETGRITNDWLGMGGGTVYAVTLDGGTVHEFVAGQIAPEETTCPNCGQEWPETMQPCPGCGVTIEQIAARFAT